MDKVVDEWILKRASYVFVDDAKELKQMLNEVLGNV
jgi:hypothetical protein